MTVDATFWRGAIGVTRSHVIGRNTLEDAATCLRKEPSDYN